MPTRTRSTRTTRPAATLVAASAVALAGLATPAAGAPTGSAPVTQDDAVEVVLGGVGELDVLANDSDPDGDDLAVCRLADVPERLGVQTMDDGSLVIFPMGRRARTYTFTYYACDLEQLTPATVTVTTVAPPPVKIQVLKADRPGRLRVTNRGSFPLHYLWGSYKKDRPDGRVRIAPHTTEVVEVRRRSVIWVALNSRKGAFRLGIVRGIEHRPGADLLPPGAPRPGEFPIAGRAAAQEWSAR